MDNNVFIKTVIVISIGLVGWLFYPFLKSFFVALLLVSAFNPIHIALEKKLSHRLRLRPYLSLLSATLMTLFLFTVLFVPIIFFTIYIASHPTEIMGMAETFQQQFARLLSHLPASMEGVEKAAYAGLEKVREHQSQILTALAMSLGNGLLGFMGAVGEMMSILVFFFFLMWYRRELILAIAPVIPVRRGIRQEFINDMISTTATGFYTLIGVAVAQGLAFGIFISFFKLYDPWLFGLMVAVTSVIPIFGTALIWIPVAINEFFNGNSLNALIILIYSWAMLSFFIDNVVRLIILQQLNRFLSQGRNSINDFLIFFAIAAGLSTFGFWGFLLGPAIVSFLVTLLRIMRKNHRVSRLSS